MNARLRVAITTVIQEIAVAAISAAIWLLASALHPPTMRWWYPPAVAFVSSLTTATMLSALPRPRRARPVGGEGRTDG